MSLAYHYQDERRHAAAEATLQKLVGLQEARPESVGLEHALALYQLAQACRAQGKLAEAEPLYGRALAADERAIARLPEQLRGGTDLWRVRVLNDHANVLRRLDRWRESEDRFRQALAVADAMTAPALDSDSPLAEEASTLEVRSALLHDHAHLLWAIGRQAEAADLDARADAAGAEAKAKRKAFEEEERAAGRGG